MKSFRTLAPLLAIILSSLIFPLLIGDTSTDSIAVDVLLLTGAAVAWNIFSGYTGYISLGHATYYGLGAYILALACQGWHIPGGYGLFLLLPLAGLGAGVFSIPLGWIALRTRRYTFMVITIAIFFIFQLLGYNLQGITGGAAGIFLPLPTWNSDFYNAPFYYVALALLLLAILVSWWIRNTKYGLVLLAIRDDEDRVRGLGIRVGWYKLGAYMLSAALTGMIGALAIYFAGLITPSFAFDQTFDISIITMTFFGGIGTVMGPIVGGLLLEPLQTYLNQQFGSTGSSINQILFGCFLLAVILLLPQGIVPSLHKRWSVWRASRNKPYTLPTPSRALKEALQRAGTSPAPTLIGQQSLQRAGTSPAPTLIGQQPLQRAGASPAPTLIGQQSLQRAGASPAPTLIEQQRNTASLLAIPHRPSELPVPRGSTQKVRSQRLVPISPNASMSLPGKIIATPVVSWRCPSCQRPFLLKDDICYCPKCGTTRPLA